MKKAKHLSFDRNFDLYSTEKTVKEDVKEKKINLAKYLNLGYYLIIPIILGILIGKFLDNHLKKEKFFFIIFFSIGVISSFYNLFKIYKDVRNHN